MSSGAASGTGVSTNVDGLSTAGPPKAAPLDRAVPRATGDQGSKVQQPKPQALPSRGQGSAILVSLKQKGNPILSHIRGVPWEWAETPADYVLGQTTCALFLSLKYHRLHPEYVYQRIKGLHGKFNLRIILTMVDIPNHEESLKELSKTSLINNVTLILCWTAQEGGRYLELFKSCEHAAPTSIKAHQSSSYSDRLVDFITVPRSVNKTDAVSLVSTFGSLRTAINATPEEIGMVAGWGGKKVQRWCGSVREPFRVKKAARRGPAREDSRMTLSRDMSRASLPREDSRTDGVEDDRDGGVAPASKDLPIALKRAEPIGADPIRQPVDAQGPDQDEEFEMMEAVRDPHLSDGIAAALEKLRKQ